MNDEKNKDAGKHAISQSEKVTGKAPVSVGQPRRDVPVSVIPRGRYR